jgi:glycosyltransferase involved in cell wall biosynthesis
MKIVFFAHPLFLGSQSMPRFVNMLADGMERRGHEVEVWSPEAYFSNIPVKGLKKWLGYMDQYLVFPQSVKSKLKKKGGDVLYVVSDHALGPYVPLIADLPHVIHCHDFLAQRSALGEIPENVTSASGQKYQAYIRNGYSRGRNFISVSEKTRTDLAKFLREKPERSEMVYNGLNPSFKPLPVASSRANLGSKLNMDLSNGYILHVGGNQWYKNRVGVIGIYDKWRKLYGIDLPLLLIGQPPSESLQKKYEQSAWKKDIHFFSDVDDEAVSTAYSGASVFLFPSIAEGFGWPIAEAMASGTLVVTTNEAPMLEVAGDAAFMVERRPLADSEQEQWTDGAALILNKAITLNENERAEAVQKGLINVSRFKLEDALDNIERIYKQVLNN